YRSFVITDRIDYFLDRPEFTKESSRRGYLVHRPNIVYHWIWNDYWSFALSIDYVDHPQSDFGDAERVIHLPVVLSCPMLLHGTTDWEEFSFRKLPIPAGRYSLFSKGWNLGAEGQSEVALAASDDDIWDLPDIEKYEWT